MYATKIKSIYKKYLILLFVIKLRYRKSKYNKNQCFHRGKNKANTQNK